VSWSSADHVVSPAVLWLAVAVLLFGLRRGTPPAAGAALSARRAMTIVIAAWAVGFAVPTVRAVVYLVHRFSARFVDTGPQLLTAVLVDYLPACLVAALVLLLVTRRLGTTPAPVGLAWPGRDRRSVRELLGLVVVCLLAQLVSPGLEVLLPRSGSPWDRKLTPGVHPWFDLDAAFTAARAAIGEELLVVVVPVVLLRAAKVRTQWIVLALLAMRISYHVYYGWASLDVLVWGSVFLALYLARGWIWPQLIAHFIYAWVATSWRLSRRARPPSSGWARPTVAVRSSGRPADHRTGARPRAAAGRARGGGGGHRSALWGRRGWLVRTGRPRGGRGVAWPSGFRLGRAGADADPCRGSGRHRRGRCGRGHRLCWAG